MHGRVSLPLILAAAACCAGSCDRRAAAPPPAPAADAIPGRAQPRRATVKLWLGAHELVAEIASNTVQMAAGLMYRTNLAEHEAMLFVFPRPHRAAFYMKNTSLPLSCAYLDREGSIREIHPMIPFKEESIVAASDDIQYVLETTRDWFARHNIRTGTVVRAERGTLSETFFGR